MTDVIIRTYGRDSLLVWSNLLLAPVFAMLGLRVGAQSEDRLAARMEADATAMRRQGYLVASVERLSLPGLVLADAGAHWYRVRYERTSSRADQPST